MKAILLTLLTLVITGPVSASTDTFECQEQAIELAKSYHQAYKGLGAFEDDSNSSVDFNGLNRVEDRKLIGNVLSITVVSHDVYTNLEVTNQINEWGHCEVVGLKEVHDRN